jgi:uncharacterized protein YerC
VFFGYTRPVPPAWYLMPDGSYKRLSSGEDVLSDVRSTVEDVAETMSVLRDLCRDAREASLESRRQVAASRRERRLRSTTLRIVSRHG